ncbi:MAG: hypothetical protein ABI478_09740, partial [Propionivibrio sp.]
AAFAEVEFFALVLSSLILPTTIYAYLMWKKAISRKTILFFGTFLITISGVSIFRLKRLEEMAITSPSLFDDRIFASEISIALYLLPLLFAGIGVNLISHVLVTHPANAERKFDQERE